MDFDDANVDVSGVDDRRGGGGFGGPIAIGGGGLGVVGLILYLVMNVLGGGGTSSTGVDLGGVQSGTGSSESTQDLRTRCNTSGAIDKYADCFVIKVYNEINETWTADLQRRGSDYSPPRLGFFSGQTRTGCGAASAAVGPFYCPPDREVFIDLGFLRQLQTQFGAEGRNATAYIVAHEIGHHIQTLLGTERKVRAAQESSPASANRLSVAMELQADCYAGVSGRLSRDRGNISISEAELDQALNAAAAVGDDRIQQKTSGRVDPESWTHGSSEQRRSWYLTGFQKGDLLACDTFNA